MEIMCDTVQKQVNDCLRNPPNREAG